MTRSRKLPALHFYPGDWKKDLGVQSLDFFDRHVWFEMLLLMHDSELRGYLVINGKPMDEETIARLIGLPQQIFSKSLANIKARGVCGVADDGAIFNRKMVAADELSSKRSIAGKAGADARLHKQNASNSEANRQANAEDDTDIENDNLKENIVPPFAVGNPQATAAAKRLSAYFKEIGKPCGKIQAQSLQSQWAHDVPGFIRSVDACVSNGWKNLRPVAEEESQSRKKSGKHEKFELVLGAVRKFGADWEAAKKILPAELHPAIRSIGWGALCRAGSGDIGIKNRFFEALE